MSAAYPLARCPPISTTNPSDSRSEVACSTPMPPVSGISVSTPAMSIPLGGVKSSSASHCWTTFIASPHIGPATVEPNAEEM